MILMALFLWHKSNKPVDAIKGPEAVPKIPFTFKFVHKLSMIMCINSTVPIQYFIELILVYETLCKIALISYEYDSYIIHLGKWVLLDRKSYMYK